MATVQEAIYNALKSDSAIATKVKVGTFYNIHAIDIPENKRDTCSYHIVYQKTPSTPIDYIDLERTQFQITCLGDTYAKAQALREDVIRVLTRYKGNLGGQRDIKSCTLTGEYENKTPDTDGYFVALTFKLKFFGDNV